MTFAIFAWEALISKIFAPDWKQFLIFTAYKIDILLLPSLNTALFFKSSHLQCEKLDSDQKQTFAALETLINFRLL